MSAPRWQVEDEEEREAVLREERYDEEPAEREARLLQERWMNHGRCPLPPEQRLSEATRRGRCMMMGIDPDPPTPEPRARPLRAAHRERKAGR